MPLKCPKCSRDVPDDSVYCPYCGHGIQSSARTTQVSTGATLLIVAAVAALIIFIQSVRALTQIYSWYPVAVAELWIAYDQALAVLSLLGFLSGLVAGLLSLARRNFQWTIASASICTLSGAGAWILSMIIPSASMFTSFLYYFLPMFLTALIATVLIYPRKAEFRQ